MGTKLASVVAVVAAASVARADSDPEVYFRVEAARGGAEPTIVATVIGGPVLPLEKYVLISNTVKVRASKRVPFAQTKATLALALVYQGSELWIGNDKVEKDPAARYQGALAALERAIDNVELRKSAPPGSKAIAIAYMDRAKIMLPASDLAKLTGNALGNQKDYYRQAGTELVAGVRLGLAELDKLAAARKVMIVIGDGVDTDPDAAKARLLELRKEALQAGVQVFAIVYRGPHTEGPAIVTTFAPRAKVINSIDGLAPALTDVVTRLEDRYELVFPAATLPWDKRAHDLVLRLDQTDLDPISVVLAKP